MHQISRTKLSMLAQELGFETCLEFDAGLLVPEQWIRDLCAENKCGRYGKHYMCPPYTDSLEEIKAKLSEFHRGVLLQYSKTLDVTSDEKGLLQTMVEFHNMILKFEDRLRDQGLKHLWGLIAGTCGLCDDCKAQTGDPCPYPDKARRSMESLAVNVVALLEKLGLDCELHQDRVTTSGCILFREE